MKLSDEKSKEIKLPRSAKIFVIIGCLLTGVPSIFMLVSFVADFNEQISLIFSSEFGYNYFMNLLFFISLPFLCVGFISILTKGKPFTRILANCLLIIGGIFTISAFITPHLSGLKIGAYEIFHMKGFTICDGKLLILGIAIVTIGYAAKYGLELQEVDDTLV